MRKLSCYLAQRITVAACGLYLLGMATVAQGAPLERQVLEELNLARTAPKAYAAHLKEFRRRFRGKEYQLPDSRTRVITSEGVAAVDEAIRVLSRQKPLPALAWSDGLAAAARDLATEQGASGDTGHDGQSSGDMRERIERHGRWQGTIGENIGYGSDTARMVVLQLIIDDGVPDRGHRANIYNKSFATAGIACGPHPRYRQLCVIDFAGGFRE